MFKQIINNIVLVFVVCAISNAQVLKPSLWEHSDPEISASAPTIIPGTSPLTYGPGSYDRERELYDYKPRFKPNIVTFDNNNRPYIMVAKLANEDPADNTYTYFSREWYDGYYVQTLDENNQWVMIDIDELYKQIPAYSTSYTNFRFRTGVAVSDDQIAFDADGGIYFYVTEPQGYVMGTWAGLTNYAFYCPDGDISNWQGYSLPGNSYLFETGDTFISDKTPPTLIGMGGSIYKYYGISRNADDTITIASPVEISDTSISALTAPQHSGAVKTSITIGEIVHFVYQDYSNLYGTNNDETGQYYSYYNKSTGEIGEPVFLGSTVGFVDNGKPDTHNGPVITADSNRNLHVVLGAHGSMMKYTYSTDMGKTWANAVDLYGNATYPSTVSTPDGTIHLVYRKNLTMGDGFKYRLWYARKPLGGAWEDMGQLVNPSHLGYSIYYHKFTVDRIGRLFLNYYYLTANHTQQELDDMATKWPNDPAFDPSHIGYPHDAVIIMSGDNGDSWKIATTDDFVAGIADIVGYYTFEGEDKNKDSSGKGRDLAGNVPFVASKNGYGAYFDRDTDNLVANFDQRDVFFNGSFTVSCNVKAGENPINPEPFQVICGYQTGGPAGWLMVTANGSYRVYAYSAADGDQATPYYQGYSTAVAVAVGQWKNITMTYEADGPISAYNNYTGTLKAYVDGELKVNQTGVKFQPAAGGLSIGKGNNLANDFVGVVDDVVVYNFALTETQVAKLQQPNTNPKSILGDLLSVADIDADGLVNQNDLVIMAENYLVD